MILWCALALAGPLDLNSATAEQLAALPGMGSVRAQAIVAWREERGPFESVKDITVAPGIGPVTLRAVAPRLQVRAPLPSAPSSRWDTADADTLSRLPGMGRARAEAVVRFREEGGSLVTWMDLAAVPSLGYATARALAYTWNPQTTGK